MRESRVAYVYGLVDPRTELVRYVGCTFWPTQRLSSHVRAGKRTLATGGDSPVRVNVWLAELLAAGLRPRLTVLQAVRHQIFLPYKQEQQWIGRLRGAGHLLNMPTSERRRVNRWRVTGRAWMSCDGRVHAKAA